MALVQGTGGGGGAAAVPVLTFGGAPDIAMPFGGSNPVLTYSTGMINPRTVDFATWNPTGTWDMGSFLGDGTPKQGSWPNLSGVPTGPQVVPVATDGGAGKLTGLDQLAGLVSGLNGVVGDKGENIKGKQPAALWGGARPQTGMSDEMKMLVGLAALGALAWYLTQKG